MKLYFLISLLIATGLAALGYWKGQDVERVRIADTCSATGFTVIYDRHSERHRHFHCFELDEQALAERDAPESRERLLRL